MDSINLSSKKSSIKDDSDFEDMLTPAKVKKDMSFIVFKQELDNQANISGELAQSIYVSEELLSENQKLTGDIIQKIEEEI